MNLIALLLLKTGKKQKFTGSSLSSSISFTLSSWKPTGQFFLENALPCHQNSCHIRFLGNLSVKLGKNRLGSKFSLNL